MSFDCNSQCIAQKSQQEISQLLMVELASAVGQSIEANAMVSQPTFCPCFNLH